MDCETLLSIAAIILLIIVSIMLGCQYTNKKHEKKRKMKWTCGVEGGCERTMHGTYDTKKECESHCSYRFEQEELKDKLENELIIMKDENEDLKHELRHAISGN